MPVCPLSPIILRSCRLSSSSSRTGPGSGGIDAHGILDSRNLPDPEFSALWNAIIVDESIKDRLLAQGLASRTAEIVSECLYLEVEPHALTGGTLGKSQKAVIELLGGTIAEQAATRSTIVLL